MGRPEDSVRYSGRPVGEATDRRRTKVRPGWWLVGYAFVLGLISIGLVERTNLWWLLPLFGLMALVAIVALDRLGGKGQEDEPIQSRVEAREAVYGLDEQAQSETPSIASSNEESLSVRETEVLSLLSRGKTNYEISVELFVSVGTVKTHINNIFRKLEVRNRTEAVSRARELNLLK